MVLRRGRVGHPLQLLRTTYVRRNTLLLSLTVMSGVKATRFARKHCGGGCNVVRDDHGILMMLGRGYSLDGASILIIINPAF